MLESLSSCVISHICIDAKDNSDRNHRKQVKNVIKRLFSGSSEDDMNVTLDMFWTEYTDFDNKIGSFDADEFIWKTKDMSDETFICGIKNIHFLSPRFLVLLHVESHQRYLVLVQQRFLGVT